jgi:hypothetical protein
LNVLAQNEVVKGCFDNILAKIEFIKSHLYNILTKIRLSLLPFYLSPAPMEGGNILQKIATQRHKKKPIKMIGVYNPYSSIFL